MFSLIITIVSIALVVALVAATMYHGGDTLTQGRSTAKAAEYVAGAQQIAGAFTMHQALTGATASNTGELVTAGMLKSVPSNLFIVNKNPSSEIPFSHLRSGENLTLEECHAFDKLAGRSPTPEGQFPGPFLSQPGVLLGYDEFHAFGCYQGEGYAFYFKI